MSCIFLDNSLAFLLTCIYVQEECVSKHVKLCCLQVPLMGSNNEFIRHSAKKILSAFAEYLLLEDQVGSCL